MGLKRVFKFVGVIILIFFGSTIQAQMLLGRFDCNAAGEGNLYGNNYLDAQMNLSNLAAVGSGVTLNFTDNAIEYNNSALVGPANSLVFSISPKDGYIVEVRKITMRIKKQSKSGNVILYYSTADQPYSNSNSTSIYNAGNSNTDTTFSIVNVSYPVNFSAPLKVTAVDPPLNLLLSSGSGGGALTIDYIIVYGYVYKETDTPPSDGLDITFSANMQEKVGEVNPLFWGTNFLFWIEDDASLADGRIETSLKNMPVTSLRYPGGTVADNFHWKTNLLSNRFRFPYEEGDTESDFDEFMTFCLRVGAEPIIVVNTESWQIAQDLDGGAQEAADWVQYCKDKGYKVKYWEIGNETYWHPFFTAREYGQTVKKYAQAMKAVDPTIKISANGHWDIQMVGTKERTTQSQWETIRQMYENIASKTDTQAADDYADSFKDTNIRNGSEKWWNNVADECGAYIDMISVHWYYSGNTNMGSMTENLNQVRQLFKTKFPDREYTMCMTEYNCNHDDHKLAISGLFDGIGRFLNAGVEIGNFWPLRNGTDGHRRSIMHMNTLEEGYAYQVLQLMGNNLKGDLLKVESENVIFPMVSYDGEQLTVFVSGRAVTTQPVNATMSFPNMEQFTLIDAKSYDAPALNTVPIRLVENDLPITVSEVGCSFKVLPAQTVFLRFMNKDFTDVDPVTQNQEVRIHTERNRIFVTHADAMRVVVYNLQGIPVMQKESKGELILDMQHEGIYFVNVITRDKKHVTKKVFLTR